MSNVFYRSCWDIFLFSLVTLELHSMYELSICSNDLIPRSSGRRNCLSAPEQWHADVKITMNHCFDILHVLHTNHSVIQT